MANTLRAEVGEATRRDTKRTDDPRARQGENHPATESPRIGEHAWVIDNAKTRIAAERAAIGRELQAREAELVAAAASGDHAAWNRHRVRRFQLLARLRTLEEEARRLRLRMD
jgi:hypothetical protein